MTEHVPVYHVIWFPILLVSCLNSNTWLCSSWNTVDRNGRRSVGLLSLCAYWYCLQRFSDSWYLIAMSRLISLSIVQCWQLEIVLYVLNKWEVYWAVSIFFDTVLPFYHPFLPHDHCVDVLDDNVHMDVFCVRTLLHLCTWPVSGVDWTLWNFWSIVALIKNARQESVWITFTYLINVKNTLTTAGLKLCLKW